MANATLSATRPTYKSQHSSKVWQLWTSGRGYRTIELFESDTRRTVAIVRCFTKWNSDTQKNVTTWNLVDKNGNKFGQYKSDRAAFKAFTKSL